MLVLAAASLPARSSLLYLPGPDIGAVCRNTATQHTMLRHVLIIRQTDPRPALDVCLQHMLDMDRCACYSPSREAGVRRGGAIVLLHDMIRA